MLRQSECERAHKIMASSRSSVERERDGSRGVTDEGAKIPVTVLNGIMLSLPVIEKHLA